MKKIKYRSRMGSSDVHGVGEAVILNNVQGESH